MLQWLRPEQFRHSADAHYLWPIAWRQDDGMPRGPRSMIEMAYRLLQHRQSIGWEFWFGTPDRVADWHVYRYEYIDELNFMPPAAELFALGEFPREQLGKPASPLPVGLADRHSLLLELPLDPLPLLIRDLHAPLERGVGAQEAGR